MEQQRENPKIKLFKLLQEKGWHLEDDCLYAPHGTFWIEGDAEIPRHTVERIYTRSSTQLEQMPQSEHLFRDRERFRRGVEDVTSLVNILKEMLNR